MHLLANRLSFFFGIKIHFLFAAELPICSRNTETLKTVSRCIVPGRFWAFSFDMSGFVLTAVSFTANHSKAAVCHFRVTKKRRIATTLLSCSEDGLLFFAVVSLRSATYCFCLNFSNSSLLGNFSFLIIGKPKATNFLRLIAFGLGIIGL